MRQNTKIAKGCSKKTFRGNEFVGFDLRDRGLAYYMTLTEDIKSLSQFAQAQTDAKPTLRKSKPR